MPSETLSAPTTEPETPSLFDPAQCARAWLQAAADTDGMLPWAWTPSIGRELRITNTATVVTAPDAGQWWTRDGDTWQPTNTGQIRAALDTWGIAHARFDEHPGRADATSRHAFQWLRAHATHGHADAGPEQYGRPPTSWAQRGADGQLPDDARGCAQAFISERHYPPAPQGGRRLGYWNGAFHRSGPAGWTTVSDHDLIELMESTAVTAKNPSVYEAAFTEWARRQPDLEPADDVDPGMREDDPTHSDQLDMLAAERDHLYEGLTGGEYDGVEFDDAVERYEVYSGIVDTERELAATKTQAPADDQAAPSWDVDDAATPVVEVEVSPARQRQWELMEQADRLSQEEGISYEEALGRVQGLDPEQVRRREFVRTAQEQSFRGTSFDRLVSEVHFAAVGEWQAQLEEATNGQYLAHGADVDLWSVNDATARKAMTPEAREWFDQQGGRVTKADLVAMIESGELTGYDAWTIQATFAANTNRHRRGDYLQ